MVCVNSIQLKFGLSANFWWFKLTFCLHKWTFSIHYTTNLISFIISVGKFNQSQNHLPSKSVYLYNIIFVIVICARNGRMFASSSLSIRNNSASLLRNGNLLETLKWNSTWYNTYNFIFTIALIASQHKERTALVPKLYHLDVVEKEDTALYLVVKMPQRQQR